MVMERMRKDHTSFSVFSRAGRGIMEKKKQVSMKGSRITLSLEIFFKAPPVRGEFQVFSVAIQFCSRKDRTVSQTFNSPLQKRSRVERVAERGKASNTFLCPVQSRASVLPFGAVKNSHLCPWVIKPSNLPSSCQPAATAEKAGFDIW